MMNSDHIIEMIRDAVKPHPKPAVFTSGTRAALRMN